MNTACKLLVLIVCLAAIFSRAGTLPAGTHQRVVHVFVALADNKYQGIVPVPAKIGNGDDPANNLYWGAAAGVKTYFARSAEWKLAGCSKPLPAEVLERCVFHHRTANVYVVADAYQGRKIRQAIVDFFEAAAGRNVETVTEPGGATITAGGGSQLVAYVGHDGLMDFQIATLAPSNATTHPDTIILACASKQFFASLLRQTGARPLLWTTNLMAPEAYTLKSALDGWILNEPPEQIRERAAAAYDRYQRCGIRGARRLLVTGW